MQKLDASETSTSKELIEQMAERLASYSIEELNRCLNASELVVRMASAKLLGDLRDLSSVEPLIANLSDENPRVRQSAADAFWSFGSNEPNAEIKSAIQRAVPSLVQLLQDEVAAVRVVATGALGTIRSVDSLPALRRAARDPNAEVRQYAIWGIGRMPHPDSVPLLIETLLSEAAPIVRRNAAVAIGSFASNSGNLSKNTLDSMATSVLLGLRDSHQKVRQNSAHALASLPTQKSLDGYGKTSLSQVVQEPAKQQY